MKLKPRLANNVGMVLGGTVLSVFGLRGWLFLGGYAGLIPGLFGVLGFLWVVVGCLALARRSQMAIVIDHTGMQLPSLTIFEGHSRTVFIRREDIAKVSKHESFKGRLIEVTTTGGGKVLVQARHYCELDDFITHCRKYGLPVA